MKIFYTITMAVFFCSAHAQQKDITLAEQYPDFLKNEPPVKNDFKKNNSLYQQVKPVIIPASLIVYGFIARGTGGLQKFDHSIQQNIQKSFPGFQTKIDDYLQYAPAAAVFGLDVIGIKGKNDFKNQLLVYVLSAAITGISVESVKKITKELRPDGSARNSFPSGHTATAFAAAEFLRQEYKNNSPWYGIAGYATATTTGVLRMLNNKHWFRDVIAGAGFGILSTKIAYKLEPIIAKKLFHKKQKNTIARY